MRKNTMNTIKWIMIPFFYIIFLPVVTIAQNISVPFTSQAPQGNWSQPWFDACEETSVAMVDAYYRGGFIKESIPRSILEIFNIKHSIYGQSLDENADTIASLINNFLPWEAEVRENPTLEEMKAELDNGRPIIIPADGKALRNPYFRNGGPPYHMFVISGYDDENQQFIAQEPGTRFGNNLRYSYETVMNAMHDFVPNGGTPNSRQVAIFTRGSINSTDNFDGDGDGLSKAQEIKLGTSLWHADTDRDGFSDGNEVETGYSPFINENALLSGSYLMKSPSRAEVYLVNSNLKHHITSEQVFLNNGWRWSDIITVSDVFLRNIPTGNQITN